MVGRSIVEWISIGVVLTLVLAVVDLVVFGHKHRPRQRAPHANDTVGSPTTSISIYPLMLMGGAGLLLIGLPVAVGLLLLLLLAASDWTFISSPALDDASVSLTLLLMLTGGALYLLRQHARRVYGSLEMAVAAMTAYSSVARLKASGAITDWLAVAGAVYLVVRGLDNLMQGIQAAKKAEREATKAAESATPGAGAGASVVSLPALGQAAQAAPGKGKTRSGKKGKRRAA